MNQILELLPPAGIALPPIGVGVVAALFSFYFLWRRPLNLHVTVALLVVWVLPSLFSLATFEWLHQQHVWRVKYGLVTDQRSFNPWPYL
ncbi:MAG: hypothetical protein KGZ92_05720 [Firmicutes bacterium]|nr:hypothetical protein [Dethiobacter sp.]MBS3888786.1 hypothetical protein [Bacillota bacterium]MBS4054663.1 hypothetical protein [Thermaerobacter sp.]